MRRPDDLQELSKALVQSWNITPVSAAVLSQQDVHEALVARVKFLLKHDFDRLTSTLYLLDVPESRYRLAMAAEGLDGKAEALATAIFERELEKLYLRRRYKHEHSIGTRFEAPDAED
jgi:hypothetical protein